MSSIALGPELRAWQKDVVDVCTANPGKYLVLAVHRRAGKTELVLQRLLHDALSAPPLALKQRLYAYFAPFRQQARTIAWARLKALAKPFCDLGMCVVSESDLALYFSHNNSVLRLFGADNEAFRGAGLCGVALDEVGSMKADFWQAVVMPALADNDGWAWLIGTPNGINLFSEVFTDGLNPGSNYKSIRYTVYETDALNPSVVEKLKASMATNVFNREFLCSFDASSDNQLISTAVVEEAASRVISPFYDNIAPYIIGVDVARFGGDRSVIFVRRGLVAYDPIVFNDIDNMLLAQHVARNIDEHDPMAVFIDGGGGSGVIDRLRQLGYCITEVNFGGSPMDALYVNKRTEMWDTMGSWLAEGASIPDRADLKKELVTPTYVMTARNKIQLESKEDIKKRMPSGASPDLADALALTFAYPIYPRQTQSQNVDRLQFDPLNKRFGN